MGRVAASESPDTPTAPAGETAAFQALLTEEGARLLAELRDHDPADELALATRLRRDHSPALVSAALGQARLRQRAAAKFGASDAARMYFTPDGVEQATRSAVAAYRARRLAELGVRRVADLCCGIGGDAIELARAGIEVLAVDRSPLTCAVLRANADALGLADRVRVRCADVTEVDVGGFDAVFADPARRGGRGRVFDPEAYSPPLSWALRAARRVPHAALKLAPGVPHEALPADAEAEWISVGGEVKEAVLWFGSGAGGAVRATLLPGGHSLVSEPLPAPPVGPVGRYLYEPDGAVIRAHLVAQVAQRLDGRLVDATIAYVTADALRPTPYARAYEVTDVLPFHLKRLRALLRERGVGTLTVKKRGSAVDPEDLRRRMRLAGPAVATVFLTRVQGAPTMLLAAPVAA
ncbi:MULTISPECIES: class I SAM-dependent methyltransferase [Streptomyces]|uniref:class I SAM-dependent methyltransferase n=1 Tax=Streptomyces TaxID=1883 RepID=UPI0022491EF1|nr:class I SAM-dependent methyltransferase [Streptomyces sp. JHD 1]MCX2971009.1 class I SAM-dependent methyltransferase [Streptomyces sp. JHD 1]